LNLPAFAEIHGLCPWMNAKRVSAGALRRHSFGASGTFGVGGCASAGSAEDGGATGSAREAPLFTVFQSDGISEVLPGTSLEFFDGGVEIILYLASSQAPKSMNLHLREQKGKNFTFSDCSGGDRLTILRQTGHLLFLLMFSRPNGLFQCNIACC